MAVIIADTDVLIDFVHSKEPGASWVARAIDRGILRTSTVTQFELLAGSRTREKKDQIAKILSVVEPLPLTPEAARRAAAVRRTLERAGRGIGTADYLIAGIVLAHDAVLMTRNRAHFERIEGLSLV